MFIIVDGENKTGKSSLVRKLQEVTGFEVIKFSQPKKEPYLEYIEFLLTRKEPAIIDRFYLGEHVYGPLWRGKDGLEEWQDRMIEMVLAARGSMHVYCETDVEEIKENFVKDGEEEADINQVKDVLEYFNKSIEKSRLEWYRFDYREDQDYLTIVNSLINPWLEEYKQRENKIKALIPLRTIGAIGARTLIMGDECNSDKEIEKYKHVVLPFSKGISSNLLWNAIDNIPLWYYSVSNAMKYHMDHLILLEEELSLPNLQIVICLGNNSYNYVSKFVDQNPRFKHLVIERVSHPAYIARMNLDINIYGKKIKELMA